MVEPGHRQVCGSQVESRGQPGQRAAVDFGSGIEGVGWALIRLTYGVAVSSWLWDDMALSPPRE